jgi:hypothetical protein
MNKHLISRLAAMAVLGLTAAGCDDLLVGPGLTENPNRPVEASAEQLLIGIQGRQFVLHEGQLARIAAIWTQQIAGVFNQQKEQGSQYNYTENDISQNFWRGVYTGGGLVDIRKVRAMAKESGNARLEGIAKVWEAFLIGMSTSVWGDIPYREAVNPEISTPKLDPQQQIYADLQTLLDDAIAQLQGAGAGSLPQDLIYNGDAARWIRAARTLKARYYMHTAARLGNAALQSALTNAQQGINEAPTTAAQAMHGQAPGDFRGWGGTTVDDGNVWALFNDARTDLAANERLINVLRARNDPRLAQYFSPADDGQYRGADRFGLGPGPWSLLNRTARAFRTFRQPLITWAENQFIIAEAQFRLGQTGPALAAVNAVRTAIGMPALTAPITLEQIMVEKWIAQFQNIDAYADWRRTCFPVLRPGGLSAAQPAAAIPGRYPYGNEERLQNPNIPLPSQAPPKVWAFAEITCPTTGGTI